MKIQSIKEQYQEFLKGEFKQNLKESFYGNMLTFLLLNMVFPFVVTKLYGADVLGSYTYGYSMVTMVIYFATMGLDTGLLYFIPKSGDKYISASFICNIGASSAIILIMNFMVNDVATKAMLPLIWLLSAEQLFFAIYRSKRQIRDYFKINIGFGLFLRTILTGVFYFIFEDPLFNVILATYISTALSLVAYTIQERKSFGKIEISKEVIAYSLPLIVGSMMTVIMNNIDSIMIGNMMNNEQVAIYNVAAKYATFPSMILTILNTVFPPIVAKLYYDGELDKLRSMYKLSARTLAVVSSIVIILLILFRKPLLLSYGEEYLLGGSVIIFRGIGQVVNAGVGSVWYIVSMTGHPKVNMFGKILAAILNVVFNAIFIPAWGIAGAAFASMVSVIFVNLLGYLIVSRILKVKVYGII